MCKTVDDFSQIKRREGFAHFHGHFYIKMPAPMWPQYLPFTIVIWKNNQISRKTEKYLWFSSGISLHILIGEKIRFRDIKTKIVRILCQEPSCIYPFTTT